MSENQPTIPVEAIAAFPPPGLGIPDAFTFSLDSRHLMYLYGEGNAQQQLYVLDIATGEKRVLLEPPDGGTQEDNLSPEEELRRQRLRMLSVGITQFERAETSNRLLLPLSGNLYVFDSDTNQLRQVLDGSDQPSVQNPTLSKDGSQIAFVQDAEICTLSAEGGQPRQTTSGARGTGKTHGLAEFNAQEELGRLEGFWWSPDGQWIAYTEVDETHIPVYRIMHQGKDQTGANAQEDHRYPFAGEANAIVQLAVTPVEGAGSVWMNLDYDEEIYINRVFWWPGGRLGAEILNRTQSWIEVVAFDIETGDRTTVLREANDYWINAYNAHFIALKAGGFIWASERTGYNQLYYYDSAGHLVRQLTSGAWAVDAVLSVDEEHGQVYFTGNRDDPTEQHLYVVSLDRGDIRRMTPEAGTHDITIDEQHRYFVDVHSALDRAPSVTLRSLTDSAVIHSIHTPNDPRLDTFDLQPPEIVSLKSRDGVTLYGAICHPPEHYGPGPYPTVVYVYGGPKPQLVANEWPGTAHVLAQYLRERGYLVFCLDNRGSARRGIEFEGAIKHRLGTVEVEDQVDGVRWLIGQGLADPERIGINGYSYGGYMTLMCLMKAPGIFKVGVAGAPVTAWDGYDTGYTERYMGTPQSNPEGYAAGNVMNYVENLQGKLLLIHGMLDENVHFRHTSRLINALIRARKDYDLLIFPDERHMPRHQADRVYLWERAVGYIEKHL